MRFGSVCSGIEAASVAFAALDWKAAWLSEVDIAASAVLAHRFGATAPVYALPGSEKAMKKIDWGNKIINWGDMTKLPDLLRSGEAEAPDILVGGPPCQGFSIAGLRGGLIDPRSQLTLKFVELANVIDDTRTACGQPPCAILYENVPGLRSDSGNAFGHFLAALVGADDPIEPGPRPECGRSSTHWSWKKETSEHIPKWPSAGVVVGPRRAVGWRSFDAQYFALAQRRERVFLVASAREGFDPAAVLFEFDGLRRDSAPRRDAGEDAAGTINARTDGGSHWDDFRNPHPPLTQSHNTGGVGSSNQELFSQGGAYLVPERSSELVPQWWDGSPVSQTLDAVLHKGQTMPEKNRFPAVLQPVIPILEAGARTGNSTTDLRAGIGIGIDGDPMFTLQSSKQHAVAICLRGISDYGEGLPSLRSTGGDCGGGSEVLVLPFNTTQITSPQNGANPQWGDPCFSLASGNHPPAVAISVALRGREGGGTAELGDEVAGTLRASGGGGGDKSHVLTVHGTQNPIILNDLALTLGRNSGQENAVCVTGDITHALKADGFDGSEDGTGRGQPIVSVAAEMAVRRLMPIECERLQGFPDNHTLVPVGKGMAADGPRYKQLGNSWPVPVVTWIGNRLDKHLAELDGRVIQGSLTDLTKLLA